jgi:RHS repeat-associated protein
MQTRSAARAAASARRRDSGKRVGPSRRMPGGVLAIPEVQLYHYKARAYDAEAGLLLQTDPSGYDGGLNLYLYADDDPVNLDDPFGLKSSPSGGGRAYSSFLGGGNGFNTCSGFGGSAAQCGRVSTAIGTNAQSFGGLLVNTAQAGLQRNPGLALRAISRVGVSTTSPQLNRVNVHGNSYASPRSTQVYNLVNRTTGGVDKVGITSNPNGRYTQAYLDAHNVRYRVVATYHSRYPAIVHENIALTHHAISHGSLPRLNKVPR